MPTITHRNTRRKPSRLIESTMRRRKRGTLRSSSGDKVTSRKQAIAIALSEARDKGARVPPSAGDPEEVSGATALGHDHEPSALQRLAGQHGEPGLGQLS